MVVWNRKSGSSDGASPHDSPDPEYGGKTEYQQAAGEVPAVDGDGVAVHGDHTHLHRGLKSRHITMIAIGGAIGTGLIIGTGKALAQSGYVVHIEIFTLELTSTVLPQSSSLTLRLVSSSTSS